MRNITCWSILGICFLLFCTCSGNNKDVQESKEKTEWAKVIEGSIENTIRYKIDLLCLKYDISSESVKQELVNYIKSQDSMFQAMEKGKQIDQETILRLLMQREKLDIDKLKLISARHNVPIKTLANLLYDYEIWDSINSIER